MKRLLLLSLLGASLAHAQSESAATLTDEPTFRQIFGQSVTEAATLNEERQTSGATLELGGGWLAPSSLTLRNRYYESALADTLGGMPGAQLRVGLGLGSIGPVRLSLDTGFAYRFGQGVGPARSVKTNLPTVDSFRVHWFEAAIAPRLSYPIGFVMPFLQGGVGVVRAMRSAYLDGQNDAFWIPVANATAGVIVGGQSSASGWFGGVSASVAYESHLGGSQDYRGVRAELGLRTRL